MTEEHKQALIREVRDFQLPPYQEIPDVGLYLEQVTKYLNRTLSPLGELSVTSSMISNYVKRGLVDSPVKKQYNREQISHLLFIALAKSVLSLDSLQEFIRLQRQTYTTRTAYDYFCLELQNMLLWVFGAKEVPDEVGVESTDEKKILRTCIIAISHKIYLEKSLRAIALESREAAPK